MSQTATAVAEPPEAALKKPSRPRRPRQPVPAAPSVPVHTAQVGEDMQRLEESGALTRNVTEDPIAKGTVLVAVVVRSPAYKSDVKNVKVETRTQSGQTTEVKQGEATAPKWKWDRHELFRALTQNGHEIGGILDVYTVPLSKEKAGLGRICTIDKLDELKARILEKVDQRMALVDQLADRWYAEVIPELERFFGAEKFYQIQGDLPHPENLREKYDVVITEVLINPAATRGASFEDLSPEMQRRLIERDRAALEQLHQERCQRILDLVFQNFADLCGDLIYGKKDPATGLRSGRPDIETGSHKSGYVTDLLNALDRLANFRTFANEEVMGLVEAARQRLQGVDVCAINENKGQNEVAQAIKAAMAPLGEAVQSLIETRGRAMRKIKV